MRIYLGESGLDKSWQEPFEPTTKCHKCGGEARIMFVGQEYAEKLEGSKEVVYVCDVRKNNGQGDLWPHDVISVAVYLCKDCFEPIAIINQA